MRLQSDRSTAEDACSAVAIAALASGPATLQMSKSIWAAASCPCSVPAHAVKVLHVTRFLRRLEKYMGDFRKTRVFRCHRQLSPIMIVLQIVLKCHKFRLRRESSDFLPECVASCKFASMTHKTIAIWLRAYVSSPTLHMYEVSESKTDASERSPLQWKLPVQPSRNLTHCSWANRERVIGVTPWMGQECLCLLSPVVKGSCDDI